MINTKCSSQSCAARHDCQINCGVSQPTVIETVNADGNILTIEALDGKISGHKYVGPYELQERMPIATLEVQCVDGCSEVLIEQGCQDDLEALAAIIHTRLPAVPQW